jgi:2-(1,2-epoxy-1,2-dihydrophenyl)acetyl-CoA isomerase
METLPELLETIEDGIATLTFNRPERMNALSTPIMEGLLHGLPRVAGDPAVKVVVLTGAGRASLPAAMSRAWRKAGSSGVWRRRRRICGRGWKCPASCTSCRSQRLR